MAAHRHGPILVRLRQLVPGLPRGDAILWERRVERDQKVIDMLESEVRTFLAELEEKLKALETRYPVAA